MWHVGDTIADLYDVRAINTEGGMSIVYFVWHRAWRMELVIKSPRPEVLADDTARARFIQEAETWVDLGLHPNIVTAYYVRQIEDFPRIVIEKMAGGSLKAHLANGGRRDLATALDLAIQVASGLAYASHRRPGFVHRDIKPANVLLTPAGDARVTDFGLAGASGARVGTPAYMAPEVWVDPAGVTAASDLYSFGVMLYELIAGRRPFARGEAGTSLGQIQAGRAVDLSLGALGSRGAPSAGDASIGDALDIQRVADASLGDRSRVEGSRVMPPSELEWFREQHLDGRPDPPSRFVRDLPPAIDDLSAALLAKDPRARPDSMDRVVESLKAVFEAHVGPYAREEPREAELVADALNNRALSYLDLGAERQAVRCWHEALAGAPTHFESTANLGYWQWARGVIDDGTLLARLSDLEPQCAGRSDYWEALSAIHRERGDRDAARGALARRRPDRGEGPAVVDRPDTGLPSIGVSRSVRLNAPVHAVACSPAGAFLTVGGKDGLLKLLAADSLATLQTFEGSGAYTQRAVGFFGEGNIFSGTHGYEIYGWRIDRPRPFAKLAWPQQPTGGKIFAESASAFALTADRTRLVAAYHAPMGEELQPILLFDIEHGTCLATFGGHLISVEDVALVLGGRVLASAGPAWDAGIKLWDVATQVSIGTLEGHLGAVHALAAGDDGRLLLSGGGDGEVKLWDVGSRECLRTFQGHTGAVYAVAFARDEEFFLSAGVDASVRLWHRSSGRCLRTATGHAASVYALAPLPAADEIVSAGQDGTVRVWDVRPAVEQQYSYVLSRPRSAVELLRGREGVNALVNRARELQRAGAHREAYEAFRQAQGVEGFEAHPEIVQGLRECGRHGRRSGLHAAVVAAELQHDASVTALRFSPDGARLATGSKDGHVRIWEVATGREILALAARPRAVTSLAWLPDGRRIASTAETGTLERDQTYDTLQVSDVTTGHVLGAFAEFRGSLGCVAATPDGRFLVTGDWGERRRPPMIAGGRPASPDIGRSWLRVWDASRGACLRAWPAHDDAITAVDIATSSDLASASRDGSIAIWALDGTEKRRLPQAHRGMARCVRFSPDGRQLLSGGADDRVRLWDVASGVCLSDLAGHEDTVHAVAFADGRFTASAGEDRRLLVRDLQSGEAVRVLEAHTDGIVALDVAPDGRNAASGGHDRLVRLWELDWDWTFDDS